MRLHIEHTTAYAYARPVSFGRHRLVIRPREGHDLRVEGMELRIEPAHRLMWTRDVFGNSIALVDWLEPWRALSLFYWSVGNGQLVDGLGWDGFVVLLATMVVSLLAAIVAFDRHDVAA